jgi:hypothetical protein
LNDNKPFAKRCFVSENYKFIWFNIKKAGTSSIFNILFHGTDENIKRPLQKYYKSFHQIENKNFDEYFKFCNVRNPFTRFASGYADIILKDIQNHKRLAKTFEKNNSFEYVLDTFCDMEDHKIEPHFTPMSWSIMYDKTLIDYTVKMETFEQDWEYIFKNTKINKVKVPKKRQSNSNDFLKYYKIDRIRDKIINRYKKDFDIFGYSTDLKDIL